MFEVLGDGRVALDPTASHDRLALSIYVDLLRQGQEKAERNELERLLDKTRDRRVYHLIGDAEDSKEDILQYLNSANFDWIKVVVKLTPEMYMVNSESEATM